MVHGINRTLKGSNLTTSILMFALFFQHPFILTTAIVPNIPWLVGSRKLNVQQTIHKSPLTSHPFTKLISISPWRQPLKSFTTQGLTVFATMSCSTIRYEFLNCERQIWIEQANNPSKSVPDSSEMLRTACRISHLPRCIPSLFASKGPSSRPGIYHEFRRLAFSRKSQDQASNPYFFLVQIQHHCGHCSSHLRTHGGVFGSHGARVPGHDDHPSQHWDTLGRKAP